MPRSLTIFAATDLTADRVDAAPGIEPPANDEVYLLEAIVSGRQLISWSRDRSDLMELVRRRGYDNHQITKLGPANRIKPVHIADPASPRDRSLHHLPLSWESGERLVMSGYRTFGQVADMPLAEFRRLGFTPEHYRYIAGGLAKVGLKMSFDLLPGERKAWSPKRRSA